MIEAFGPPWANRMRRIMVFLRQDIRRIAVTVGVILLLLFAAWFFFPLQKDTALKLTRDNYHKIRAGMTLPEVEAILDAPPNFSSNGPETTERFSRWANTEVRWSTAKGWISEEAELTVLFDEEGKAVDCRYYPPGGHPPPALDRLRNQVKYQWRLFWQ